MAKFGVKHLVVAKGTYTSSGATYNNGIVVGGLISADIDIKFAINDLYSDNGIAESDTSYDSGTVKFGTDEIGTSIANLYKVQAYLFGHEFQAATGDEPAKLIKSANDHPDYLGTGYFKSGMKNNVKYFETTWIYKTKFTPPKESGKTKEKSISWQTPEFEGNVYLLDDGIYQDNAIFDSEEKAIAYLNNLANVAVEAPETPAENGG